METSSWARYIDIDDLLYETFFFINIFSFWYILVFTYNILLPHSLSNMRNFRVEFSLFFFFLTHR